MYKCAVMALEELKVLSFFEEKLHFAVNHVPNVKSDLSQAIDNMEYTLQQVKIDEQKIQKDFRSLFNLILPLEQGAICSEDLQRLHILVSKYYDLHLIDQQDIILFFRSKLLQLDN